MDKIDYVRREIGFAMSLGLAIVPVLVGNVSMPAQQDLPEEIKPLVDQQYLRMHARSAEADAQAIVKRLTEILEPPAAAQPGVVLMARFDTGGQADRLATLVREAVVAAAMPATTITVDGGTVALVQPGAERAVSVVGDFVRALADRLATQSAKTDSASGRVRLAMHYTAAAHPDPATALDLTQRLLEDPGLSAILGAAPQARLLAVITDDLHRVAVAPGHRSVPSSAYRPLRLADHSTGWVHLPGCSTPADFPGYVPGEPDWAASDRPATGSAGAGRTNSGTGSAGSAGTVAGATKLPAGTVNGNIVADNNVEGDLVIGDKVSGPKIMHLYRPAS